EAASLVVALLRYWWGTFGRASYPEAKDLLVITDIAGTRGKTDQAWKVALQSLADEVGLALSVCYLPSGTTRWARVEQTLTTSLEVENGGKLWRHNVTARVIGSLRSAAGMVLRPEFEAGRRPESRTSSGSPASIVLIPEAFYSEWNYTVRAHNGTSESV